MSKGGDIRRAAATHGGTAKAFSQSSDIGGLRAPFTQEGVYIGGMCHSLCLYWMKLRNEGGNLIDWLMPEGAVDVGRANVIIVKTACYKNRVSQTKTEFDDAFIKLNGLKRAKLSGFDNKIDHKFDMDVVKLISGIVLSRGAFVQLSMHGSGHAVVGWVDKESTGGATWFDPNYGECSFPDFVQFAAWFHQYMSISTYKDKYKTCETNGYAPD